MKHLAAALVTFLFAGIASADQSIPDKYPESVLYDEPREVIPGVWSSIGATAPPTYENSGMARGTPLWARTTGRNRVCR